MKKHRPTSMLQHPRPLCDPSLVPYSQPLVGESLVAYDHSCASCVDSACVPVLFGAPDDFLLFVKAPERYKNFTRMNHAIGRLSNHKEPVPDSQEEQAAQLVKTTVNIGHYVTVVRSRGVLLNATTLQHPTELEASAGFMDGKKGLNGCGSLSVMARHFSRVQVSPRKRSFAGLPDGAAVIPGPMGYHRPTFELQQPWSPYDASLALYAQLVPRKCLAAYDEPCASGSVVAGVIAIVGAARNILPFVTAIERRYNFTHLSAVIDRISKYKNTTLDSKEDDGDREELVKSRPQVGHQAIVACDRGISELVAHRHHYPDGKCDRLVPLLILHCALIHFLHLTAELFLEAPYVFVTPGFTTIEDTVETAVYLEAIVEYCAGVFRLTKTLGPDARGLLTTPASCVTEGAQGLMDRLQHLSDSSSHLPHNAPY
ncbi:hypothetical protein V5799_017044 [Amblyomma americanum]|uniref:Uncharacterized protein n=1 Tax=Amblyomma americanum TaxID=6943 RepID=A0AAQ4F4E7_AMBAM